MAELNNSNKFLIESLVNLLRQEVNGWSTNSEYNVDNVWGKEVPASANDEFPRGIIDITSGNDFELSIDQKYRLREVTVKLVVFGDNSSDVEDLIDDSEDAISDFWQNYTGDWSFREVDSFTELNEGEGTENMLRYNRSQNFVFETVKED